MKSIYIVMAILASVTIVGMGFCWRRQ